MKDVEKSRTSFIRVNLRGLREKHLFQCPRSKVDLSKMQVCSLLSSYRLDIRTNLGEFNVEDEGAVGLDTLGALLAVTEF